MRAIERAASATASRVHTVLGVSSLPRVAGRRARRGRIAFAGGGP